MTPRRHKREGASARDASPLFSNNQHLHCAADYGEVKRLATAKAKCALAGYSLVQLHDGKFLVGRWMSSKELADLTAVEQFPQQVSP